MAQNGDIVDLEDYAKRGEDPPKAERYLVRIDKQKYEVSTSTISGRELLALAGKHPIDRFRLDMKLRGGQTRKVELDETVDLTMPGLERFMTLPLDQTEGADTAVPVRAFRLPEEDEEHLDARGLLWETVVDGGAMWLLLHDFPVPQGYNVARATLAVRIESGYPTAPLDMCYVSPRLALLSGRSIRQADVMVRIGGADFQRWSRHRTGQNPWRPGEDSVITHLALIEEWFAREVRNV